KIRDDLWARAQAYKQSPQFSCVEPLVACYEVQLVWMGQEYSEGGWRHANSYIGIAEQMAQNIDERMTGCAPPAAKPVVAAPKPVVERLNLGADALFAFDKAGRDNMLPAGRARLEVFAEKVKLMAKVEAINVTGYTDRLGGDSYNQALSQRRAETVKAYLVSLGVPANVINTVGRGRENPVKECNDKNHARLVACLQPNRRVEIELKGYLK
ncbi:MAG TPA: OmpA family protein, partial [Burkholderiales bacterium]